MSWRLVRLLFVFYGLVRQRSCRLVQATRFRLWRCKYAHLTHHRYLKITAAQSFQHWKSQKYWGEIQTFRWLVKAGISEFQRKLSSLTFNIPPPPPPSSIEVPTYITSYNNKMEVNRYNINTHRAEHELLFKCLYKVQRFRERPLYTVTSFSLSPLWTSAFHYVLLSPVPSLVAVQFPSQSI